jgi:hypothetical protein
MHGTVSHNYLNKNILPYGAKNVNTSKMLPPVFAVSVSISKKKYSEKLRETKRIYLPQFTLFPFGLPRGFLPR